MSCLLSPAVGHQISQQEIPRGRSELLLSYHQSSLSPLATDPYNDLLSSQLDVR